MSNPFLSHVDPATKYPHLAAPTERVRSAALPMQVGQPYYPRPTRDQVDRVGNASLAALTETEEPYPNGFSHHMAQVYMHAKNLVSGSSAVPFRYSVKGILHHTGAAISTLSSSGDQEEVPDEYTLPPPSEEDERDEEVPEAFSTPPPPPRKIQQKTRQQAAWVQPAKTIAQAAAATAATAATQAATSWLEQQFQPKARNAGHTYSSFYRS